MELQTIAAANPLTLSLGLPLEQTANEQAAGWLDELDGVDVVSGDIGELAALADRAPTDSAREWLRGAIFIRQFMRVFTR